MQNKIWGTTDLIVDESNFQLHRLCIRAGGSCSIHYHEAKVQYLFVVSGVLRMRQFSQTGRLICENDLVAGEAILTSTETRHQFVALTDIVAYEAYHSILPIDDADIVRLSEGSSGQ